MGREEEEDALPTSVGGARAGRRGGAALPLVLGVALLALALAPAFLPGASAAPTDGGATAVPGCTPAQGFGPNQSVSGRVIDDYSGAPLPNVTLHALDFTGCRQTTHTDAAGRFTVESVPGAVYLTADPPDGYTGVQVHVAVGHANVTGVVLALIPSALLERLSAPGIADYPVLLAALLGSIFTIGGVAAAARRRLLEAGRSGALLSRFGQYVVVRSVLIPLQLLAVLIVLYVFGSYLPAIAFANRTGCLTVSGSVCASCPISSFTCQLSVFGTGLAQFVVAIFTGQWGFANFGNLRFPAVDFLAWWLPNSLELAAVALAMSVAIGYPLGLSAGWWADGLLDRSMRGLSILLLLIPTFLVVLFLLTFVYAPWNATFGDNPYGLYPSPLWYLAHGGFRAWIGIGGQTTPTGLPVLDGALRGDWSFVEIVGLKLLVQAFAIAIIYVSIFFRFARHAFAEAARSEAIRAARSRGVPEETLAWHHSGRRVLPVLVLIFGMTLPAYIGTQAIVEVLFNDNQGLGTILFSEITQFAGSGFGILHRGPIPVGNLYQITIFFLALLLLIGNLCADVLARYLDHSLEAREAE